MTRKLLPYEHDLVDALGITKEEYLEFVALQQTYKDVKEGTVLDVTNTWAIAAVVLTVIGLIFQVVSALLMPKPKFGGAGERQTREERFSPRFGFNSTQELAKYGDPVPLVYTNTSVNSAGGVRLAGSLLWSAVRSYGSNQFLQMLMLLGGGKILAIDPAKSAFGQTAVVNLVTQNKWVYFNNTDTGLLSWANELESNYANDPTVYGKPTNNPYRIQPANVVHTRVDGFSQAYSPSSANIFGTYSPVPLNVRVYLRNESGDKDSLGIGITVDGWSTLSAIAKGSAITVRIQSTKEQPLDTDFASDLNRAAIDARRGLASAFDDGGIFKLGSARFRVSNVSGVSTDEGDVTATLVCIKAGNAPSMDYNADEVSDLNEIILTSPAYTEGKKFVNSLLDIDARTNQEAINSATYYAQLPADQKFVVLTAADLIKSGRLYRLESVAVPRLGRFGGTVNVLQFKFVRTISPAEMSQLQDFVALEATLKIDSDDRYYIKALTRIEEASYNTVSSCHIVDIAMKVQTFRRISGRQRTYGREQRQGYMESDNGIQLRTTLFLMYYRVAGGVETLMPGIFAVRRAAEQDNYIYIKFNGGNIAQQWQFRLEPIFDPLSEIKAHPDLQVNNVVTYFYIQNAGESTIVDLTNEKYVYFTGFTRSSVTGQPPLNTSPDKTNEWDLFSLDADTQLQLSSERGPEFTITAVTEQVKQPFTDALYKNMSLIGFNVFSGKSLQDMRSFTAFVTKGRSVRGLRISGQDENGNTWGSTNYDYYPTKLDGTPGDTDGPTCFAPDIFLDTVLDTNDGIGKYAQVEGIDLKQLAETKRFCKANNLFMDGVIADLQNWREFWVNTAPFSLLEFSRSGGREALVPAVPYYPDTGKIKTQIAVSALFNQGNILEDSYKEENLDYGSSVQDLIATVVYRNLDANGVFAVNRTVEVKLADSVEADAIRQNFDLSAFVTTETQAILFAKLLCNTRRYVRTAIEFKTFPTTSPVAPGAFIYVDIGQNNWDGVRTGLIGPSGKLNMPIDNSVKDGSYEMLLYQNGQGVVKKTVDVSNGVATFPDDPNGIVKYEGYLFVLGTKTTTRRVFRVNQVEMDEEGEVLVRATGYPCDSNGNSKIADFTDSLFTVTS